MRIIAAALAGLVILVFATPIAVAADGGALFAKNCASCHGADGGADTPVGKAMKIPVINAHDVAGTIKEIRESDRHKTISPKLNDEELAAIAEAVSEF